MLVVPHPGCIHVEMRDAMNKVLAKCVLMICAVLTLLKGCRPEVPSYLAPFYPPQCPDH